MRDGTCFAAWVKASVTAQCGAGRRSIVTDFEAEDGGRVILNGARQLFAGQPPAAWVADPRIGLEVFRASPGEEAAA